MTAPLLRGLGGLLLLLGGGELLVRGASALAARIGLSRLAIGLTVVAFGTSAPELAVSVGATLSGRPDLAVGNVVGSNIFNVLFILGASALVVPLVVGREVVRREAPVVVVASAVLLLVALDGRIARWEGALMAAGLLAFLWTSYRAGVAEVGEGDDAPGDGSSSGSRGGAVDAHGETGAQRPLGALASAGLILLGLALLVFGSGWLIEGASAVARSLGVSELIIGLTLVAAGTSFPELATSVLAALRGEREIAVGNVLGSNVFNVLGILGVSALVGPEGLAVDPAVLRFDLPVMMAVAVACLPLFFTGHLIARWEGALLLAYYAAYVIYLFLSATEHAALGSYSMAMLLYVIPITAITIGVVAVREVRGERGR